MPLRYLFVDMNAFFASVEQQDFPELRGKPVAVVPVKDVRTTCCLAASYEAKRTGIKTGMPVWEALALCPELVLRVGRHDRYTEVHHGIVKAVGRCVPVDRVMSIDEMACKLIGEERMIARATAIAHQIKREIAAVGDSLRCSIGVGPNVMLAKVAGDMKKPDGLTFICPDDLPTKLYQLKLTDFPGIGRQMEKRLHRAGITEVRQLMRLTVKQLSAVWGSKVHGERWYHVLRGEEVWEKPTTRRTVGHSHVMAPEFRTDAGAYGVMSRLIHKAAARLRTIDYWAGALSISVRYEDGRRWEMGCKLPQCQDTLSLLQAFGAMWRRRPPTGRPQQVAMVLTDLVPTKAATPSLFEFDRQVTDLSHAMDRVNRQFGKHKVHFGVVHGLEETAPVRIAFSQIPEFDPAFV